MISASRNSAIYLFLIFVLFSCSKKEEKFQTYPVNISENIKFPLSEIVEKTQAIELELTDRSMIRRIKRVVWDEKHIFVLDVSNLLLFDSQGKFIRQIGSKGQGPGDFLYIVDVAIDFKNKRIYMADTRKVLCYDFDGNYLKEHSNGNFHNVKYMNLIDDKLYFINEFFRVKEGENKVNRSVLYIANKNTQITDSLEIKKIVNPLMVWTHPWNDLVNTYKDEILVYSWELNAEPSLRDTVYRISDHSLVPQFCLDFQNNGIDSDGKRNIYLYNIWRSSRFIFSVYGIATNNEYFRYCYDTKTHKSVSMKDGYFDDIYSNERVDIRPLSYSPDEIYYTFTKVNDETLEEPNPTLCIGKLKK